MDQPAKMEFNVDGQYENEKGIFTVISIHKEKMVIRWENGEEISTDIELQRRILERREWEKLNKLAEGAVGKSSKSGSRKKPAFTGFAPTDFKKSASGTTWRSRSQLGEAITQKIDTNRFQFKSWAFSHKPEMHVQDIKHHGHEAPDYHARFFVRVDQNSLHYGFRVARSDDKDDVSTDWDTFIYWLTQQENEETLRSIAAEDELTVCNIKTPSSGTLRASDNGWHNSESGQKPVTETLAAYIDGTPETKAFDLEFSTTINKNEAVESGLDIAENIAQLFTRLLPLYRGAVIR